MATAIKTINYKSFARKTVRAFNATRKNNGTLFSSILDAYLAMHAEKSDEYKKAWKHYCIDVTDVCDKTTFNKIVRICKSDVIMSNLDKLPLSWATLTKIAASLGNKDLGEERVATLLNAIESGAINRKKTAKEVMAILEPSSSEAKQSNDNVVRYDSSQYDDEQRAKLDEALAVLKSLGFDIKDVSKESEERKSEEVAAESDDSAVTQEAA